MSDEMELAVAEPVMRLRDKIDTIRQTVAKNATPAQLEMFLTLAERYQLDPFLKEIWYVPEVGIMTGRDGYLKIALRDPNYDGIVSAAVREGDEFTMEPLTPTVKHQFGMKRGAVIGAYAVVFHKGRRPAVCYADMAEYRKQGNVWGKYQSAMIQKVAEVMALKRQFGISGLVTEEEVRAPGESIDAVDVAVSSELETILAGMRDRTSIADAIHALRTRLEVRLGEEAAAAEYERLLAHYGIGKWEDLGFVDRARKFAADLYHGAQSDAAE